MPCSPSYLFVDMTLWMTAGLYESMVESYNNRSSYLDKYDCGLTTVPCESEVVTNLISLDHSVYYWFDLIVVNILMTIVVVVGIAGNITNIVIFSTHRIVSDSTNMLLLAVAVSDLLNLVVNAWLLTACFLCYFDEAKALSAFNNSLPATAISTRFLSLLSLDFVIVISLQRAAAILLPFKVATIFSPRNTRIIIACFVVAFLGVTLTVVLCNEYRWLFHPYFNESISLGLERPHMPHHIMLPFITYYTNSRSGIGLTLLFLSGSVTVVKLYSQVKARVAMKAVPNSKPSDSKMSDREASMVKMSLAVCVFTFVFYILSMTCLEILLLYSLELFQNPLPVISQYLVFVCNSICSSFNFFLYITMSPKYRDVLRSWLKLGSIETK